MLGNNFARKASGKSVHYMISYMTGHMQMKTASTLVSVSLGHVREKIRASRDYSLSLVCERKIQLCYKMVKLTGLSVRDIRFPTSLELHGSDAMVGIRV